MVLWNNEIFFASKEDELDSWQVILVIISVRMKTFSKEYSDMMLWFNF